MKKQYVNVYMYIFYIYKTSLNSRKINTQNEEAHDLCMMSSPYANNPGALLLENYLSPISFGPGGTYN